MGVVAQAPAGDVATDKLARWANAFEIALAGGDGAQVAGLFAADGYWRDILALEWSYRTFGGRDEIAAVVEGTAERARPRKFRLADGRMAPRLVRRGGRGVVEGYLDFEASAGRGSAFVRLLDEETPAAWLFLTALQDIGGHEETVGPRRPTGVEYSYNFAGDNWLDSPRRCAGIPAASPLLGTRPPPGLSTYVLKPVRTGLGYALDTGAPQGSRTERTSRGRTDARRRRHRG
jgi:hypothetical protein